VRDAAYEVLESVERRDPQLLGTMAFCSVALAAGRLSQYQLGDAARKQAMKVMMMMMMMMKEVDDA
jgi:hypothetical protein